MKPGCALILVCLLLVAAPTAARADQTDDYIKIQMDSFHLPGLSLVVLKDGQIIKARGYGLANVESNLPAHAETVYKIGSVSKQFIATGIMLLVQDGRIELDDPINAYLDDTPPAWAPITIRHLLTHTSGLERESPGFDPFKTQSDADIVKASHSTPLRFRPGDKWEYSNLGYYALAEIIRIASGQPWDEFLRARVFNQSVMTATLPTNTTLRVADRAKGYGGKNNAAVADDWTALRPSGAFLSTVLDLAKWEALLLTDQILTESTRRQMWTSFRLNDGTLAAYGFGWHVESWNDQRILWHGGGIPGFASYYLRFPDDGLTIIALSNGDDVDMGTIVRGIAAIYF